MRRFIVPFVLAFAASLHGTPVKFDIPAQPAPAALGLFMKQSGTQVAFAANELAAVTTHAIVGEFEPPAALAALLKDTGFTAREKSTGWFTVVKAGANPGSVRGSLTGEGGRKLPGVLVAIRETGVSATTDEHGQYVFPQVAAGTYVLVATAAGYQPLHLVDVMVKAGRDLTLGQESLRKVLGDITTLEPMVVRADTVTELEKIEITGSRGKPFEGANVDIPRTINDAQPYYIFNAEAIDRSGATNVQDFLKQRLTMNTVALTPAQSFTSPFLGNTSRIDLRGLGSDKTLILVNGRRVAGVQAGTTTYQADLNGIPLGAIERVEVLPSSASGIYGGSAIGGVINVILRKEYAGAELRMTYDNTWDADAPNRSVTLTWGQSLEDGRTHLLATASWSDARPLLQQDRIGLFERGISTVLRNDPNFLYSNSSPFLGATPNIARNNTGNLTLDNGTSLGSMITHIPAGTAPTTPLATLRAGLLANAGRYTFEAPASTQSGGLRQPFGYTPETKSFRASLRRQMIGSWEVFLDFSYQSNHAETVSNPIAQAGFVRVAATAPTNPFLEPVRLSLPSNLDAVAVSDSRANGVSLGFSGDLPAGWRLQGDYTWSQSRFAYDYFSADSNALAADLNSGVLNPFVDTILYPLALEPYLAPNRYAGRHSTDDLALRGSGPLPALPWGTPTLTAGLGYRTASSPGSELTTTFPLRPTANSRFIYFPRSQNTMSAYSEADIPLLARGSGVEGQLLSLQLSGRTERYEVDTGTPTASITSNGTISYGTPNLNGAPYTSQATYTSTNATVGLKYQPVPSLTLRTSYATAFLPPSPAQLVTNPQPGSFLPTINDPRTGTRYPVATLAGGNPGLKPEHAQSWNAGVIWEPAAPWAKGLRLNLEYYRIIQLDKIGSLGAQQLVSAEADFPDRVTRDANGLITLVDTSLLNLTRYETEGVDLSADYRTSTALGVFSLQLAGTYILHEQRQTALNMPLLDYAGFVPEGGPAKWKANATLGWEGRQWSAGWTARHFGAYKQFGAAGGPDSILFFDGLPDTFLLNPQGGDTIPSQVYHDIFFGWCSKRAADAVRGWRLLDGLNVQAGVKNVFGTLPPFEVGSAYYMSPYGDIRLRTYWISLKKSF